MGVYLFKTDLLLELLEADANDPLSCHDFDHDVLPAVLASRVRVLGHAFCDAGGGDPPYWRDVATVDGYWRANMELLAEKPPLALDAEVWPIWTLPLQLPPARFLGQGYARNSIVCGGAVVAGAVRHSLLSAASGPVRCSRMPSYSRMRVSAGTAE
jgi:glucose-1-phosphate adenylyltransferase